MPVGHRRGRELGVHNLECVTYHIVGFSECAERGQYLVVDALRQKDLVKRVLEPIPRLLLTLVLDILTLRVVDIGQGLLNLRGCLLAHSVRT